jgi:ribonuclease HI
MVGMPINPYAIYVYCDGSMDYNSRNTGGVGLYIKFPETVELTEITRPIGRYEGANIERLELEAISQGLDLLTDLFKQERDKLASVNKVIFVTDRIGVSDKQKTSAFRIRDWRHNNWKNFEDKPIKNSDLLDEIDKKRKKLSQFAHCSIEIIYQRRKHNRRADKAAKEGKKQAIVDKSIELKGVKIGKRLYSESDIEYKNIGENQKFIVHIFKKEPVRDEWEICADICDGKNQESKIVIYADSNIESVLHRHHKYQITVSKVYRYHVRISDDIVEVT